nr:hypothetical protein [Pseudomonas aeruginosa]
MERETSLDISAAHGIEQQPLWRFAAASQAFSASASRLGAARAPANATLASLAEDYSLRYAEMALANAQVPMQALFGVGALLKVPAYALFAENDTAQSIAAITRPSGWPSITAEALLAASENGELPLRSGAVLKVSPALTRNTADGSANLATLANLLGTLPRLLAGDNASLTILTPGITFSVAVTEADAPEPIRSLVQVCTAFAALGVNISVTDLGQSHQALPAIFQANQLISSTVWVAGNDDSLGHNGSGLDQAALAALNTRSVNLFEMGTLLYLGDFNAGAGISADGAQTLHQFADAHACPAELLLGANPDLAVPADGALARISHSPAHWAVLTDAGRRRWRRLPTALISGKRLRARLNKALAAGWTGCDVEGDGGCAAVSAPRRSRHRRRDRTPPAAGRPNSWPL